MWFYWSLQLSRGFRVQVQDVSGPRLTECVLLQVQCMTVINIKWLFSPLLAGQGNAENLARHLCDKSKTTLEVLPNHSLGDKVSSQPPVLIDTCRVNTHPLHMYTFNQLSLSPCSFHSYGTLPSPSHVFHIWLSGQTLATPLLMMEWRERLHILQMQTKGKLHGIALLS